jgi:serine/threonine-protein kinase HipA
MRLEDPSSVLEIHLGEVHVGTLRVVEIDHLEFFFNESYLALAVRPVLGQHFEDDPRVRYRRRLRLPFFSNLLPEGRLRELLCSTHGLRRIDDVRLLALLGEDLPGAVRAMPQGALDHAVDDAGVIATDDRSALRFSLAGVQLKFSMLRQGKGLTLPAQGRGGDWIVKLPDPRFALVPENEYSMLKWARAAGIEVPVHELVLVSALEGLPDEAAGLPGRALAVERFDRQDGKRVHIEDFAQVLDVYADHKYEGVNFEQIASVISRVTGDVEEFVRRLVFNVFIGNADAHLKNWSLLYPDGITARLSPAYDLVSTIQYLPDDRLALNLARSKDFDKVSLESFARLARKAGLDEEATLAGVEAAVTRIRNAWQEVQADLPIPNSFKTRLTEHQARVPLLRQV